VRRLALIACALSLAAAPAAGAAPTIQEFPPVPTANAGLQDIVLGPDGNIWFTERNANMIGRISGSSPGATTEFPLAGGATSPDLIVVGPDNALWWTQGTSVGRMVPSNPAGVQTFGGLGIIQARGIAVGPDGNLWVSDADPAGPKVHRITPAGAAASLPFPLPMGVNPRGIARGADGNMWVADFGGGVVRVSQAGAATRFAVPVGVPIDVIAGVDGNIWYGAQGTAVGKVTPAGVVTPYVAKGVDPFGVTLGPDGAVWYAEFQGNAIGRVDKAGATSHVTGLTAGAGPRYVARGSDNTVWFTEETGNRVGRVRGIDVGGGGGGGGGTGDTTKPKLSKLRLSARRVRRGGTIRIRYTLSEPASVTLTVARAVGGRKVGGRCVKAKRSNRNRKRCTRFVKAKPTIRQADRKAGQNRVSLTARMRPGPYRLSLTARDLAGNRSAQLSTRIEVLSKRKRR
jgi:virginiamycin B lyase